MRQRRFAGLQGIESGGKAGSPQRHHHRQRATILLEVVNALACARSAHGPQGVMERMAEVQTCFWCFVKRCRQALPSEWERGR